MLFSITNIRTPDSTDPQKASRGVLVTDWLARGAFPDNLDNFNPFSLMIGDQQGLQYLSNRPDEVRASLGHGVHGLSNAVQGERWPRKERLNRALISWLGGSAEDPMTLFGILGDAHATHVDAHPIFIRNAVYGTRCSTILPGKPVLDVRKNVRQLHSAVPGCYFVQFAGQFRKQIEKRLIANWFAVDKGAI
jgi:uncharacterized protein with NRDE domain